MKLELRGITKRFGALVANDHIDLTVEPGEIHCLLGENGAGKSTLMNVLYGFYQADEGEILLDGSPIQGHSVRKVLDAGVGFVPEDRNEDGLVGEFTIQENLMLDRSTSDPFVKGGNIQFSYLKDFAEEKVREFDVRTQSIDTKVGRLSGGNAQKVVLARELSRELRLFVAAQPTRGLDVGSIEFVHKRIVATRDAGVPVIVVSTELDEVAALADRIAVMYRGGIVGIVPGDTSRDVLGLMMAGESPEQAGAAA